MQYSKNFLDNQYYNQSVFQSGNFKVIPSLGSLVEGWILIVPKEHYLSFGAINNENLYKELRLLIEKVGKMIEEQYGQYIIFEHGPVLEKSNVGCSVDYAHIHLLPLKLDFTLINEYSNLFGLDLKWTKIKDISQTSEYISNDNPYLYYSDVKGSYVATHPNIPSQYFRKIIAKYLALDNHWNWKEYPFEENIHSTINKLKNSQLTDKTVSMPIYE